MREKRMTFEKKLFSYCSMWFQERSSPPPPPPQAAAVSPSPGRKKSRFQSPSFSLAPCSPSFPPRPPLYSKSMVMTAAVINFSQFLFSAFYPALSSPFRCLRTGLPPPHFTAANLARQKDASSSSSPERKKSADG